MRSNNTSNKTLFWETTRDSKLRIDIYPKFAQDYPSTCFFDDCDVPSIFKGIFEMLNEIIKTIALSIILY